jgi:hypothetical protein
MERCRSHGFLNCKCEETLGQYLARQFREATSEGIRMDSGKLEPTLVDVGDLVDGVSTRGILGGSTKR